MKKIIVLSLLFTIVVLSSGCMDSGIMDKYEIYMQLYNNDVDEYDTVLNELIEKQDDYTVANDEYIDAYNKYANAVSVGARGGSTIPSSAMVLQREEVELDEALSQLVSAKNNYKFTANTIYSHLDEIEMFVISNEKILERNGIDTVQHKTTIQDWKEGIRYNTMQYNL